MRWQAAQAGRRLALFITQLALFFVVQALAPTAHAEAFQRVQIMDADGNSWLAVYSLQRQHNKSWLITGCAVVQSRRRMA